MRKIQTAAGEHNVVDPEDYLGGAVSLDIPALTEHLAPIRGDYTLLASTLQRLGSRHSGYAPTAGPQFEARQLKSLIHMAKVVAGLTGVLTSGDSDAAVFIDRGARPLAYMTTHLARKVGVAKSLPRFEFVEPLMGKPTRYAKLDDYATKLQRKLPRLANADQLTVIDEIVFHGTNIAFVTDALTVAFPNADLKLVAAVGDYNQTPNWSIKDRLVTGVPGHEGPITKVSLRNAEGDEISAQHSPIPRDKENIVDIAYETSRAQLREELQTYKEFANIVAQHASVSFDPPVAGRSNNFTL